MIPMNTNEIAKLAIDAKEKKKADIESLLESASLQTKALVRGLLEDTIGERNLVIQSEKGE